MQNFHNLELAWLKDGMALAEKLNFSRAADARYITQSAFSRRIQSLEEWVGTPLFMRNRRGVQLTEAGAVFCAKVPELLRTIDNIRRDALDAAGHNRPDVVIAATHSLSFSFFPELLRRNDKIARFGSFRLISDTLHICERILIQGEAQFLLSHYHPHIRSNLASDRFTSVTLGLDRLLPYSKTSLDSREPLWKIEAGKKFPCLAFSDESGIGRILANSTAIKPVKEMMNVIFTADLAATLLAVVRAGEGIAWLPETLAATDVKSGNLSVVTDDPALCLPVEIRLYRPLEPMAETAEALWDIFSENQK